MALGVERAEKDNDIDTSPPGGPPPPTTALTENTESFHRLSTWQEWAG